MRHGAAHQARREGASANLRLCQQGGQAHPRAQASPRGRVPQIRHTLEEINAIIEATYGGDENAPFADPVKGSVCFGSAKYGWSFTLNSFARLYADIRGVDMDTQAFARRLWGDMYFNEETRTFRCKPPPGGAPLFVQFILEPLYKISQTVGEHRNPSPASYRALRDAQAQGVQDEHQAPHQTRVRKIFGDASGLVDMLCARAHREGRSAARLAACGPSPAPAGAA